MKITEVMQSYSLSVTMVSVMLFAIYTIENSEVLNFVCGTFVNHMQFGRTLLMCHFNAFALLHFPWFVLVDLLPYIS